MPYNSNVPLANDKLRNSQGDLLDNNASLFAGWNVNHETFNVANSGKHKLVTFPQQISTAIPNPSVTELNMFAANSADTGQPELFYLRNGEIFPGIPITSKVVNIGNGKGHTYLPSGILINFGTDAVPTGDDPNDRVTIILNTGDFKPYNNLVYKIFVTPNSMANSRALFGITSQTGTQFNIHSYRIGAPISSVNVNWMTIGVPS